MTFFALSSVSDNVLRSQAPKFIKSLKMVQFTNFFCLYSIFCADYKNHTFKAINLLFMVKNAKKMT